MGGSKAPDMPDTGDYFKAMSKYGPGILAMQNAAYLKNQPKFTKQQLSLYKKVMPELVKMEGKYLPKQERNAIMSGLKNFGAEKKLAKKWADVDNRFTFQEVSKYLPQYDDLAARTQLDLENRYGPGYAQAYRQRLQAMDPKAFSMREKMLTDTEADLVNGRKLNAEQLREAEQAVRAAQASRGNIRGNASIFQEAMEKGSRGEALYDKRLARAGALSQNVTPDQNQVTRPQASRYQPNFAALSSYSPMWQNNAAGSITRNAGAFLGSGQPATLDQAMNMISGSMSSAAAGKMAMGGGNPWMSALGGGMQGMQLGNAIGGALGGAGLFGLGSGAAAGMAGSSIGGGLAGAAAGVGGGAAAGATAGSAVPVIGTIIGALAGAGAGLAMGS